MNNTFGRREPDSPDFAGALRYMADAAIGAYSLTMLCNGTLYALRDPNGLRPLVLGEMKGGWVIASETCALDVLHADYVREIEAGELVTIGPDGVTSSQLLPRSEPSPCIFELVYFSRPNSTAFGQSVYNNGCSTAFKPDVPEFKDAVCTPEKTPGTSGQYYIPSTNADKFVYYGAITTSSNPPADNNAAWQQVTTTGVWEDIASRMTKPKGSSQTEGATKTSARL